ncbi:MAG: hypothetical protein EXS13_03050 [Planctomycetes bacterium]|nr:hypothetical protein [Planctomycetota bacterium]
MKGLWILAGLAAAAVVLAVFLMRDSTADVERLYIDTVRERATIRDALEECGDLVRYFNEIKPTERKKSELETLRRKFETLEQAASSARDDEALPREERRKSLSRIEEDFWELKRDAEDLRARLTEMKNYEAALRPAIARLGELTQKLLAVQSGAPPDFQQRSSHLIEEGRKYRSLAENALRTLSVKIGEGRTIGVAALKELDAVLGNMAELLATREAKAEPEATGARGGD